MGLNLCVFDRDLGDDEADELGSCDVGHYSDFGFFRDTIVRLLRMEAYPTLMLHSDCDGEWSVEELPRLKRELQEIGAAFRKLPPSDPVGAFEHTAEYRWGAKSLYECFHDVSGTNLFESLLSLCDIAQQHGRPIVFM